MKPKDMTRRILQTLAAERATHGHGAAAEIDYRLGKSKGYLGRVFRQEVGLQVETLFRTLDALEADPVDFFARVLGTRRNPERLLSRLERQLGADGPTFLHSVARRLSPHLRPTPQTQNSQTSANQVHNFQAHSNALEDLRRDLARWDERRFSAPTECLEPAESLLHRAAAAYFGSHGPAAAKHLAYALGILGSLLRLRADFGASARCLRLALELSRQHRLVLSRADLLQRAAYLIADQGEYRVALDVVYEASDIYTQSHDLGGVGRSLVDRAVILFGTDEREAAIQCYTSSLEYLPESAWNNRFSAYQGLGWIHMEMDQLDAATHWVTRAETAHRTREGPNWWRLVWLRGEISLKSKELKNAETALRSARDAFIEHGNPFDIALISLQLAKALLLADRWTEMRKITAAMLGLLKPFQKNRIASAAIHELTRAALTGEVTVELLDRVFRQIKDRTPYPGSLVKRL